MGKEIIGRHLGDLRHLKLFPKRYKTPQGQPLSYWTEIARRYGNAEKTISSSDYHWRVIEYKDGRKELAYLRVLQGGFLTGAYPAIYRGIIFPKMLGYGTFAHIKEIRLAF